jgi:hypothetical protein
VIINRDGLAVHVIASLSEIKHDLQPSRTNLRSVEDVINLHPAQPCDILADKGDFGEIDMQKLILLTPTSNHHAHFSRRGRFRRTVFSPRIGSSSRIISGDCR